MQQMHRKHRLKMSTMSMVQGLVEDADMGTCGSKGDLTAGGNLRGALTNASVV